MKIGIIDYHADFTQIIKNIVPDNHEVIVYDMNATNYNDSVDIMCAGFWTGEHKKFKVKFFVLPYNTPSSEEIKEINNNPLCIGILDMSSILKQKFPEINKPVWAFTPSFPELPTYKEPGTKVISLINKYKERFPKEYEIANKITSDVYGSPDRPIDDIAGLKDAKWLLHLKPQGFVCNAVLKALTCGIPVITDPETHKNLFLEGLVKHDDNGIVLPVDQIKNYLDTVDESTYSRIKANCVAQSDKFKHPVKWTDNWWEQPAHGGFIPSVMGGVVRAAPYFTTAAMIQGSRLIQNNKERMASRRRPRSRRRHTRRAKRTYRRRAAPRR